MKIENILGAARTRSSKPKSVRKTLSLYLDGPLYDEFKKACEEHGTATSRLMEILMLQFLNNLKKQRARKKDPKAS